MATISKTGISNGNTIAATHITNIIDALDGTTANNLVFAGPVTGSAPISASAGFTGSLMGTASWATNATTAATANAMPFSGLTSVPGALSGNNNGGVSSVTEISSGTKTSWTASLGGDFQVGQLNYCNTVSGNINILLNGTGLNVGAEYSFFWLTGSNDITFNTTTPAGVIVSENGYTKMYSTGSVVTAKYLGNITYGAGTSDVFMLVGSLKA